MNGLPALKTSSSSANPADSINKPWSTVSNSNSSATGTYENNGKKNIKLRNKDAVYGPWTSVEDRPTKEVNPWKLILDQYNSGSAAEAIDINVTLYKQ